MSQQNLSSAIDPQYNCVVSASAGTGKTWLLISRIVRLLLDGTQAGNIVAITFTRKAAAEMQARLADRLRELATCSAETLRDVLQQLELQPNEELTHKARLLYERLLHNPYSVKTTTYHAFCQELLRRFPLEADIPPGFVLQEQTLSLQSEAWDELFSESTQNSKTAVTSALENLFSYCGSLYNTKSALLDFLEHRLDWWLLSEGQEEPLKYALHNLQQQNNLTQQEWQPELFFSTTMLQDIKDFLEKLAAHPTNTNQKYCDDIQHVFEYCQHDDYVAAFRLLVPVFLTKDETPRSRKESKTQQNKMGETGQQRFLELHHSLSEAIIECIQLEKAILNLKANQAWYIAGQRLIEIYQSIKLSQRILDFNDLEWHSYQLLQNSDSAQWIQYKLDSSIDHLLIDEFQDTNPTQWRLVLPLLEEMAAADNDRARSIFLVGDEKQSIYRFRRAEPKLFSIAQEWLITNLSSKKLQVATSWRSAQVIMDFANTLFSDGPLSNHIKSFPAHVTNFDKMYGRVEIFPLIDADPQDSENNSSDFRNPLERPRQESVDTRYAREAEQIASTIKALITSETVVGQGENAHCIEYQDIIILMRSRTHISAYEHALRTQGIPYTGGDKKGLLDCLEIQDMMALLEILVTPYNNLALAHVLRCPIFNASHEDLQHMAHAKQSWYEYLISTKRHYNSPALDRAALLLPRWHTYASQLPVHDVLDKIYYQADVLKSYQRDVPEYLRSRVNANLNYFIELALDIDSGRYPSMQTFLWNLQQAKAQISDAPDQPNSQDHGSYVRLLTIHAAKGLEAAVVFLADAARTAANAKPYQATVDWPIESTAPQQLFMRADIKRQDAHMHSTLDRLAIDEQQEDAHLLYVAITRSKQYLYISGVRPLKRNELGWLGTIQSQCQQSEWGNMTSTNSILCESGQQDQLKRDSSRDDKAIVKTPLIELPETIIKDSQQQQNISPSGTIEPATPRSDAIQSDDSLESIQRGQYIHRAIELFSQDHRQDYVRRQLQAESNDDLSDVLQEFINEAYAVVQHPDFQYLFNDKRIVSAYNEIPLSYIDTDENMVSGIIDRLVVHEDDIYIIDYKTHRNLAASQLESLAEKYRPQLNLYEQGTRRIWSKHRSHRIIIFTHYPRLVSLSD